MAAGAVVAQNGTMQFINPVAAGFLVQSVDVLRHHGQQLSLLLPSGQYPVGDIRLEAKRQHFLPVKPEKVFRIPLIKAVADDFLRRVVEFLVI